MGWSSWNYFHCGVTETDVMRMADVMATNGMKDAGYQYINIDDCWALYRDTNGVVVADTNSFPSGIKALADYVHSRGLKFGLYTDRGSATCAGRPGSYGYENLDALTYASWGVDYVKEDACNSVDDAYSDYTRMSAALASCGRPIVFSLCNGPFAPWMPVVGNLWRTTGDLQSSFDSVLSNLDDNSNSAFAAGPGQWNDPDMMVVGLGMSDTEDQAHFSMWCIAAAPLIAGNNLTNMSQATLATLTNPEVIAVDQDPAGVQGTRVSSVAGPGGNLEVWCKPLGTDLTTKVVALFNRSSTNASIIVNWSDILLQPGNATVRDLWARTDLGTFVDAYSAVVPTHGVKLLKIVGTGIVGPVYGTPSASFTATPLLGVAPLTVTFADASTGTISNWYWYFGDGNSANATTNSMSYTYETAGTYSIMEVVTSPGGLGFSMRTNYITVLAPPLLEGLTNYWKFDEDAGTITTDSVGLANGTLLNIPPSGWVPGKYGSALSFNGTDASVVLPSSVNFTNTFTVAAWIYPRNAGGIGSFISVQSSFLASGFRFFIDGDSLYLQGETTTGYQSAALGIGAIQNGNWYHVAVTYDNSTITAYVNGVLAGSASWGGNMIMNPGASSHIGTEGGYFFNGIIDEVMLFTRPLAPSEIALLYQGAYRLPTPVISLGLTGSNAVVSFTTVSSATYEVDCRSDMITGTWMVLTNGIPGTGGTLSNTDIGAVTQSRRYYRVVAHY
jgi:alpha-galactosidase